MSQETRFMPKINTDNHKNALVLAQPIRMGHGN